MSDEQRQTRWDRQRYDRVMGELLILQDSIIKQQQNYINCLLDKLLAKSDRPYQQQRRFRRPRQRRKAAR